MNTKPDDLQQLHVIANFGFEVEVMDVLGWHYRCLVKQSLGRLVVGDQVMAKIRGDEVDIYELLPRKNCLTRQVGKTENKRLFIASNIDYVAIVCSPIPAMKLFFFDAIILAAAQQNIKPILVMNKKDLAKFTPWQQHIHTYYQQTSFERFEVSAFQASTLSALMQRIANKKTLFIGASGVGKSTLLNTLIGQSYAKTQALNTHGQGKHTTSNSLCYGLDDSTQVIDTPGIRSFYVSSLQDIESAYPDLQPYFGQCQFRDCRHLKEPNCALQKAIKQGDIPLERLKSYQYFKMI